MIFQSKLLFSVLSLAAVLTISAQPVAAAPHPTSPVGNDISWPQCGKSYPSGQAFAIVGVNAGLATTTNACLSSELIWAYKSTGTTNQAKAQLYVNTANPGGLNTASWPQNNVDPSGAISPDPYGTCDGADSLACAWQYGWNRAMDDVQSRFVPAAVNAGVSTNPTSFPWWLDVETANTWKSGSAFAFQSNTADLEGMVGYFHAKGPAVGIYSTSAQWGQIVGTLSSGSSLNGLNNWLPGAYKLSSAQANCSASALMPGGKVVLTQYTTSTTDFDYSCI